VRRQKYFLNITNSIFFGSLKLENDFVPIFSNLHSGKVPVLSKQVDGPNNLLI
jgi:hypothetical protein